MSKELAIREQLADMATMAKSIAGSKMFGIENEDQAMALMLLCQAEGIHPIMALRRYHIIEGKPAMRADALQGEFERDGAILWHERDEKVCAATFFRDKTKADDKAVARARERYDAMINGKPEAPFAVIGEMTIIRTIADAIEKKVATGWKDGAWQMKKNWKQSPRQMLHWRCLTEGVRAMNPGLVAGVYTEDEIIDIGPAGTFDQRTPSEVAERNVREATANAGGELSESVTLARDAVVVDKNGNVTHVEQVLGPYGPKVVTADNYKERISHVGKAEGRILGRKVGEMEPPVIKWMHEKWRNSLQPSATDDDMQLKKAIEFAYKDLGSGESNNEGSGSTHESKPEEPRPTHKELSRPAGEAGSQPGEKATTVNAEPAHSDSGAKQAAIIDLRERIEKLVITEHQACSYLCEFGLFDKSWFTDGISQGREASFDDVPEDRLLYLCQPGQWKMFVTLYEKEAKPKVSATIPAKKGRKRAK